MNNVANTSIVIGVKRKFVRFAALLLSLSLSSLMVWLVFWILSAPVVASASPHIATNYTFVPQFVDTNVSTTSTVHITKTVEPSLPDAGSIISICFAISGLGPSQLDVVLAQDVSGSMNDPVEVSGTQTRLEASKEAAKTFVSLLSDFDRIAVVPYSDAAFLAHPLTLTKEIITQTIDALIAEGATNVGEGISVSHGELITSPRYVSDTIKIIVLLSDGKANRPENEQVAKEYAYQQAQLAASHNIKIYTIGFGYDVDEDLLQDIADLSGGEYFFAPNSDILETIYLTIAVELQNLVITDILIPGIQTSCSQWPEGWCTIDSSHVTTLTIPIDDSSLISSSIDYCFTATADLPPNYQGLINLPGSGICYQDSDGQTTCDEFQNPPILVGGRKITGRVFYDVNADGHYDTNELGVPGFAVRIPADVSITDDQGCYTLYTAVEPTIPVTIEIPSGYSTTTPISYLIPAMTGTYSYRDFGLYGSVSAKKIYLPVIMRIYPLPGIINGSFEEEWIGWAHGGILAQSTTSSNPYPGAGDSSALLGALSYICQDGVPVGSAWMEQDLYVPTTDAPRLTFLYNIYTQDINPYLDDQFDVHFENRSNPDRWFNTWTFVDNVQFVP